MAAQEAKLLQACLALIFLGASGQGSQQWDEGMLGICPLLARPQQKCGSFPMQHRISETSAGL